MEAFVLRSSTKRLLALHCSIMNEAKLFPQSPTGVSRWQIDRYSDTRQCKSSARLWPPGWIMLCLFIQVWNIDDSLIVWSPVWRATSSAYRSETQYTFMLFCRAPSHHLVVVHLQESVVSWQVTIVGGSCYVAMRLLSCYSKTIKVLVKAAWLVLSLTPAHDVLSCSCHCEKFQCKTIEQNTV